MDTIVGKFGGSATADAAMLRRVGAILRADPRRRCAVLSAPGAGPGGKVTDQLEALWRLRSAGRDERAAIRGVEARLRDIAAGLGLPDPTAAVRRALRDGDSRDLLVSRGEALVARLFAMWMDWPWVDAAEVIRFRGSGQPDIAATASALAKLRDRGPFVLPGFYGADGQGRVRAFPRNGSDITGALAAVGLGAAVYENWTDVDGLMTADPALVPSARPISRIGYQQMALLAAAGARVLHPDCLAPVAEAGIPTRLRSTARPEAPGTWIDASYDAIVPCCAGKILEDGAMATVTVFGARPGAKAKLVGALTGGLVAEDAASLRFLTRAETLPHDLRAAHRVLLGK